MAKCLLRVGYDVVGYNRTKDKEEAFEKEGGMRVSSLAEMGQVCDAIVACLPSDAVVREMLAGLLEKPHCPEPQINENMSVCAFIRDSNFANHPSA